MSDGQPSGPSDPFMGLEEAAVALHTMFINLVAGGFTERQAIAICAQVLVANNPTPEEGTQ